MERYYSLLFNSKFISRQNIRTLFSHNDSNLNIRMIKTNDVHHLHMRVTTIENHQLWQAIMTRIPNTFTVYNRMTRSTIVGRKSSWWTSLKRSGAVFKCFNECTLFYSRYTINMCSFWKYFSSQYLYLCANRLI